jgi:hypothetical protein
MLSLSEWAAVAVRRGGVVGPLRRAYLPEEAAVYLPTKSRCCVITDVLTDRAEHVACAWVMAFAWIWHRPRPPATADAIALFDRIYGSTPFTPAASLGLTWLLDYIAAAVPVPTGRPTLRQDDVAVAALAGHVHMLHHLESLGCRMFVGGYNIARVTDFSCIRFLMERHGHDYDSMAVERVLSRAIDRSDTATVAGLHEAGFVTPFPGLFGTSFYIERALEGRHYAIVHYLLDTGHSCSTTHTVPKLLEDDSTAAVDVLARIDETHNAAHAIAVARSGHMTAVLWFMDKHGVPPHMDLLIAAAYTDNAPLLQALLDRGCPLSVEALNMALSQAAVANVLLLLGAGCPWTKGSQRRAVRYADIICVRALTELGAVWTETAVVEAVNHGQLDTLRYLVEVCGCPVRAAARNAAHIFAHWKCHDYLQSLR